MKKLFHSIIFTLVFSLTFPVSIFAQAADPRPKLPNVQIPETRKSTETKTSVSPFSPDYKPPAYEQPDAPVPTSLPKNISSSSTSPGANPPISNNGQGTFYLNAVDADIREIIKQVSKASGKNFLIDDRVRGKVTILSEKKMTAEEAYQAFLSALEVLGFTVVTGPGDLVKIVPLKEALESPLPIYKGDSPFTDSFITRLITLKSVSALDISTVVKPLISKEGNLFAYPATNTLIVTDSGTNIDRLVKIIKEMDTQGPEQVIEIFNIKNAPAKDVADKVQKLYVEQQQGGAAGRRPAGGAGPELAEAPFISKVIPDDRTNSIIVLGSKRALPKIRELVSRLDKTLEGAQGKVHVHYLRHAEAKKMSEVLASLTSGASRSASGGAPAPAYPGGIPRPGQASAPPVVAEFEGGIKITADESTNSLIITSTQKDYQTLVDEVINKLDIPRRQVYVEVVIMELAIDNSRDVGTYLQGGAIANINGNNVVPFGSNLGGPSAAIPSILAGAGAAGIISQGTITIPRTNADGTTTNITVPSFGAVITAIQSSTNVNILSTPNLLTLDNEEAEIIVGSEVPFPSSSTLTTGGNTTFNVVRQNVGITLKLTPQVNEGDTVKMKVRQEITQIVPGASTQILTTVGPSTTKRAVETVVVAKDQQTVVIGGLVDDKLTINTTKIPFLGDIPVLGFLFKRKITTKTKTNIIVFLRPYIIRETADFLKILQKKVEERNVFIEQNYGQGQQKVIRESVRSHAAELLEYKKDIQLQQYQFEKSSSAPPNK